MAPLRHAIRTFLATSFMASPRLQSRGPIATSRSTSPRRGRQAALHGYKAVAPLRRSGGTAAPRTSPSSPRLQSRGPIATVRLQAPVVSLVCSPRLQSRGPIATAMPPWENRRSRHLSTATKPWPHCDVRFQLEHWRAVLEPLHGYKAVAPLRRRQRGRTRSAHALTLSTATKPWPHCDALGRRHARRVF